MRLAESCLRLAELSERTAAGNSWSIAAAAHCLLSVVVMLDANRLISLLPHQLGFAALPGYLLVSDSASPRQWKESRGPELRLVCIARRLLDARTTRLFWAELDSERIGPQI